MVVTLSSTIERDRLPRPACPATDGCRRICDANVVHAHHLPPTLQTDEASDTVLKLTQRDMLEAVEKDAQQDALNLLR